MGRGFRRLTIFKSSVVEAYLGCLKIERGGRERGKRRGNGQKKEWLAISQHRETCWTKKLIIISNGDQVKNNL
jgi:hypothetical protein